MPVLISRPSLRTHLTAIACVGVLVGATACSTASSDTSEPEEKTGDLSLALNVYSRELPFFQQIVKGAQAAVADADGVKLDVTYGEVDPQLQYSQVENSLSTSPDGVLVVPMDAASLVPIFQQGSTSGVPMMTLSNDLVEDGQEFSMAHVGADFAEVGRVKAQYLVETLGGKGKVGYIHAIRGNAFTEGQFTGAKEVFEANPGLEVIDAGYAGDFSSDVGLSSAENLLTAHPDLDAIYFDSDDLALGGITAIHQRGIADDDIVVIGGDGTPDAVQAIEDGTLDMTITLCGYITGLQGAELLLDYLRNGEEPAERVMEIPTLEIRADNVEEAKAQIDAGEC